MKEQIIEVQTDRLIQERRFVPTIKSYISLMVTLIWENSFIFCFWFDSKGACPGTID